jgi:hypothetical protein
LIDFLVILLCVLVKSFLLTTVEHGGDFCSAPTVFSVVNYSLISVMAWHDPAIHGIHHSLLRGGQGRFIPHASR